jgi:FkbM family methyltransferase
MNLFTTNERYQGGSISKSAYIDEMHSAHDSLFEYAEFIRKTDIARIEITDGRVVMTSRAAGIKIVCDPADKRIAPIEILNFGRYEFNEIEMMLKLIDPGHNVFDIGANVGWHSFNVAKRYPDANVYAFEPIPATFDYLQLNLRLNGLSNIHPHNFGFSDREGDLLFYYQPQGAGLVNASSVNLSNNENASQVTCRVRRIDDFIGETGLRVDFIKCDVEGGELFVYRGAEQVLKAESPIVFTEMLRKWSAQFGYHPNEIIELFAGLGYRCFVVSEDFLAEFWGMDDDTVDTNFFFLHANKHASKIDRYLQPPRDNSPQTLSSVST